MTSIYHFCKVDNNTQNEIASGELYRSLEGEIYHHFKGKMVYLVKQVKRAHLKVFLARIVPLMQARP